METSRPSLFLGVSQQDYTAMVVAARSKHFARGEALYLEGDMAHQILLLESGLAKITQLGPSGNEVILGLGVPGDALGAAELLSSGRHFTTARAFRACRTLVWDAGVFKTLTLRSPVLHHNMVRILSEQLRELQVRFREVATEKVAPRVANQLVRLTQKIGRPINGELEVGLTHEQLAQMTGTTLFTVSRLISAWRAQGTVRSTREALTICDVESLSTAGEKDTRGNSAVLE